MKATRWIAVAALAGSGLALQGCGGPCERLKGSYDAINAKGRPCGSSSTYSNFSVDKCRQGLNSCSQNDVSTLMRQADCLDKQPECQQGTALGWGITVAQCVGNNLPSLACVQAIY